MATTPYIRELSAPEWFALALLYQHAKKSELGLLPETAGPLSQEAIAEAMKPMDGPEALANLANKPIECIGHPLGLNGKPMLRHWDTWPKGDAVFQALAHSAMEKLLARLKTESAQLPPAVVTQRKRDAELLRPLLAQVFELDPALLAKRKRAEAPAADPAQPAKGKAPAKGRRTASKS